MYPAQSARRDRITSGCGISRNPESAANNPSGSATVSKKHSAQESGCDESAGQRNKQDLLSLNTVDDGRICSGVGEQPPDPSRKIEFLVVSEQEYDGVQRLDVESTMHLTGQRKIKGVTIGEFVKMRIPLRLIPFRLSITVLCGM